ARIGDDIGSIGEAAVIFACDLGARVRHHSYQVESGRRCAGSGTSRIWVDRRAPAARRGRGVAGCELSGQRIAYPDRRHGTSGVLSDLSMTAGSLGWWSTRMTLG